MQVRFDAVLVELLYDKVLAESSKDYSVVLAVSGGADSMCMAELFKDSAVRLRFALAHCNFHLRGEESDSDEQLVTEWCRKHDVRLHKIDFNTSEYASANNMSIEMAARELRYRWFGSLCKDYGYNAVAVAHNANDNAETLFLNLLRGTGVKGLSGMQLMSPLQYSDTASLIRPLLDFTRDQIEGFARSHNIVYHTDSTNLDSSYKRNRIRNEVFPVLEKINPSFVKTLNREMCYFSQVAEIADEYYNETSGVSEVAKNVDGQVSEIDLKKLVSRPHWEYLLYRHLEKFGFNSSTVASIERLLKTCGRGGVTLSGKRFDSMDYSLITTSDKLIVRSLSVCEEIGEIVVDNPGVYNCGEGKTFTVELLDRSRLDSFKTFRGTVVFDAAKLGFPFVCRHWRKGDWMRPIGLKGKKKVSDMFADLKYDILRKSSALLAVSSSSESHVAALLGERIDDSVKIDDSTKTVIRITY